MAMYRTLAFHDEDNKDGNIFALDTIRESQIETYQGSKTSRRTILVCSLILIATAGLLATWIFVARPKYYPKLQVLTKRSLEKYTNNFDMANEGSRLHTPHVGFHSNLHHARHRRSMKRRISENTDAFGVTLLTNKKDYPIHDYRLPTNLIPENYYINLNIDMNADNFTGTVRISFKCVENTDQIIFHGRRIALTNANVTSDEKQVNFRSVSYIKQYEMFIIELDGDLVQGDIYDLTLEYGVGYGQSLAGLYKSSYKHGEEKRHLVSTHFEPTDARSAFPCFDEPAFKAIFHINITHSDKLISLSNMPINKSTSHKNNLVTDEFEPTVKMSTYLVAFSVNDFKYKEKTTTSGIKVRVYAREDDYNRIDYAVEAGAAVISFYEDFFKIKYPLPKLDLLAVPDFMAGAMEDWGLVSFRSAYLIFDDKIMTVEYLRQITLVIAHELAHQWFGNLVTMKWWNDVWLNEGFANFVEMLGTNQVNTQFNALDIQVVTGWQAAIGLDSLNNSHPVSQDVKKPSEIDELFDAISYNKGAALLRMLHGFMGDDFIKGVKSYLNANKFSNADTDGLWEHLSKASSESLNVKKIMDTWALQRCFPILTLSRNSSNDSKFIVYQESLLEIKSRLNANKSDPQVTATNKSIWQVPFTYVSDESLEPTTVWLETQETKLNLDTSISWLKANVQTKGFYVVNYDNQTWYKLRQQLQDNYQVFSPVDRANIIHDVFKLACEHILDPITALEVTKYMSKEHDYLPWAMMRSKSECIFPFLSSKSVKEKFKKYMWKIQSHLVDLTMLNYDNNTAKRNLSIFERLQFMETFSYALKHHEKKEYRHRVGEIFDEMVQQKSLPGLTAEARALALMYGFNSTKETHWNYLWQVYVNSEVDTDRKLLMKAFAQVKEKKKVKQILEKSLDANTMRVQDTIPLLANVVKLGSRKLVWDFVVKNYDKFKERYGGGYQLGQLLSEVGSGFTTKEHLKEVKDFLETHPVGSKGSRTEKQIIEKIENNIRRHTKDEVNTEIERKIKDWLEQSDN